MYMNYCIDLFSPLISNTKFKKKRGGDVEFYLSPNTAADTNFTYIDPSSRPSFPLPLVNLMTQTDSSDHPMST